ncbi:MAG TPA: ATP phosphoribosyltransferase regulatory subunit [Xanthobacteraceae bacterium]|nr:ATP phosphoribosyltransferase regulatory subunit [Xanthobacteraceae bacterium]
MQAPQPSISGTRDYAGGDAVVLQTARDAIEAALRRYAYAPINPPILESPLPFLNRSGEDIRRHMYIFPDPGGIEVCLRPELTIPVCRAYLRQLQTAGSAAEKSSGPEARLCYFGPAFTYESANDRRYRQFYQAGAEFIGAPDRESADAEILAAALDALEAAGLKETRIEIGDVEIRNAFIDQLPVSERSKTRIRRIALRNQKELRTGDAPGKPETSDATNEFGELASLLASVEPGKAELLIREVFALADVRHVGGRTPEEIVERLISRTAQQAEPVSAELMQGVMDLLNVRAKPETAFKQIREHFRKFRIGSIDRVLERCDKRLRYINAYRQQPLDLQFNVGLRRGLEYYTGFLFEIYAKNFAEIGHVCGGGRYDNLLDGLGASESIPAVGFGIGLDRLLPALQTRNAASGIAPAPQALIVAEGSNREEECIAASVALRQAGCAVELDVSGRDERNALSYAAKRKIPCVIYIGAGGSKKGQARVRQVGSRGDQLMPIAALAAYLKGEAGSAGGAR